MTTDQARSDVRSTLLIGFHGTDAATAAPLLRSLHPGGVVILPRNIVSATQLADLVAGIQEVARAEGMPRLLVAVDQEGGAVQRLSREIGFTDLPSALAVGRTGDVALARALAAATGRELAGVGVNLDFAPVVDLAIDPNNTVIGTRSYGADPELVGEFAAAVIEGLASAGVLACAKHFPGHGATAVDSHVALPHLDADTALLRNRDLVPFRAAIVAGVAAVMTAHVVSPFDPTVPTTLSRSTLRGVLREELGFDGLILTDALEMKALAEGRLPQWQAAAEALRAGADVLVFEGDVELIERSVAWVDRLVERDELDRGRIRDAADRWETTRRRLPSRAQSRRAAVNNGATLALRAAEAGIDAEGPLAHSVLVHEPSVLDSQLGRAFAEVTGWRLADTLASANGPTVAVIADADDAEDVPEEADCVLVLGGARRPSLPPSTTLVMAHDLPRGLWSVIADRLMPRPGAASEVGGAG
jgi:beta-N-acetylhexosaminidase